MNCIATPLDMTSPEQRGGGCAALLLPPTGASLFDARGYPQTKYVVMLSATHPDLLEQVIAQIPRDCNLVFKLADDKVRARVLEEFSVRRRWTLAA